jgi:hypothetical protein
VVVNSLMIVFIFTSQFFVSIHHYFSFASSWFGQCGEAISKPKEKAQIIDVCTGWAGFEQIVERTEIGVRVVIFQKSLRIQPA